MANAISDQQPASRQLISEQRPFKQWHWIALDQLWDVTGDCVVEEKCTDFLMYEVVSGDVQMRLDSNSPPWEPRVPIKWTTIGTFRIEGKGRLRLFVIFFGAMAYRRDLLDVHSAAVLEVCNELLTSHHTEPEAESPAPTP